MFKRERTFESPVGLVYAEAMAKTLERLSDKGLAIAQDAEKNNFLDKINKENKENFIGLIDGLTDYFKEVEENAMDLERDISYDLISEIRDYRKGFKSLIDEVEKSVYTNLLELEDREQLIEGVGTASKIFREFRAMGRNLHALFSWRANVRIEEVLKQVS